jgi:hypothetical protein
MVTCTPQPRVSFKVHSGHWLMLAELHGSALILQLLSALVSRSAFHLAAVASECGSEHWVYEASLPDCS